MAERVKNHEEIWWSAEEKRNDVVVSESGGQCWEVVLDTCSTSLAMVGKGKQVGLWVRESKLHTTDLRHSAALIDISLGGVDGKTSVGNVLFFW